MDIHGFSMDIHAKINGYPLKNYKMAGGAAGPAGGLPGPGPGPALGSPPARSGAPPARLHGNPMDIVIFPWISMEKLFVRFQHACGASQTSKKTPF